MPPSRRTGDWYRDRGWSPAPGFPMGGGGRSFGVWDAVFLWFLLNNLNRAGSVDFFHNHRNDPGYQDWRAEASRQAQGNDEIRRQLDELDRRLAEREGQPRDPDYLPPDVPPDVAMAPRPDVRTPGTAADGGSGGGGLAWLLIIGGVGLFGLLAWRRWRGSQMATAGAGGGGGMTGPGTSGGMGTLGAMLRHKISGEGYTPQRVRVGMTITCDPTPFLLAAGTIKAPPPADPATGDARVVVQAVGRIGAEGPGQILRLYLPDGRGLFQLHPDARGDIAEARYFATIDEVAPADEAEWGAWLDPREGMIGWPQFQTKDGKLYDRVWAPSGARVPPRALDEVIEDAQGAQRPRRSQAMLYAAPTGAAAPAPQTEYILAEAIEEAGRAWVEVRAGIDVNPASLSLT
jgi:hypothetical protein